MTIAAAQHNQREMKMYRQNRIALASGVALALLWNAAAAAEISDGVVKIGVLNDQSSLYADAAGFGSVVAARMAVEDFGGTVRGAPIDVVFADHQNRADIGSQIARAWYDVENVDVIVDFSNSAVALAVNELTKDMKKAALAVGVGSRRITGDSCSPYSIHWTYDSYALANSTARAVVEQGGDEWYFLTVDYALGHALENDATAVVEATGGEVKGVSRHPLNTSDFGSFLLTAQASGANVVGLANTTNDAVNSIKQAREFGLLDGGMDIAALFMLITDVHALGLEEAQGIYLTLAYYWDMDEESRRFAERFHEEVGRMPTMVQAGVYSAVTHYLKSVDATGSDDAEIVIPHMKDSTVDDFFAKGGRIREDGRTIFDMYLFQVKSPEESNEPWDYLKLVSTIPGADAFFPLEKSECDYIEAG